ncbi:MAG: 3-dehydroquinate synthase [Spirochaetaceae bacterium]|nr:3-dehydroquinate synthase [Spirochaetaceae bacterium]
MLNIQESLPGFNELLSRFSVKPEQTLFVADKNTLGFAKRICRDANAMFCVLNAGETAKNWQSVRKVLQRAHKGGLGRDALFIGVGGGVITDLTGFAASIYMRGVGLCFVSTSLLGMTDAAIGGKTGFDLFQIKNLAGSFYPAAQVYICMETLATLPAKERKSGFGEIIKSAMLDSKTAQAESFAQIKSAVLEDNKTALCSLIKMAIRVKNEIVEEDPFERGGRRALLNLGHTFAHALESSLGFGMVTHGEAVAWGIACAARLGLKLGITTERRMCSIIELLNQTGYETGVPYPGLKNSAMFCAALKSDKKKSSNGLCFVIPEECGARLVRVELKDIKLVYQSAGIE